jgi:hypothetical protein
MADREKEPITLDYATPEARRRKEASEYFREPPAVANWTIGGIIAWIVAFIALLCLLLYLLGRALAAHRI